jgi:hypothetical protein
LEVGDGGAIASGIKTPTVIGTFQLTADSAPLTEFNLPMGTAVFEGMDFAHFISIEDDVLLPEGDGKGLVSEFPAGSHHIPVIGIEAAGTKTEGMLHR